MPLRRFLSLLKLTPQEVLLFREKYGKEQYVMEVVDYYQNQETKKYLKKK